MDASLQYRVITKDYDRSLARVAQESIVKRESDYYQANIGKVKTIDDFLKDTRLFKFAMKAYGLEDMDYAKGFMKKVLTEGVSNKNSYANKLTDERYRQFAKAYDFVGVNDEKANTVKYFKLLTPVFAGYDGLITNPQARTLMTTVLGIPTPPADYKVGADPEADNKLVAQLQEKLPFAQLQKQVGSGDTIKYPEIERLAKQYEDMDTVGAKSTEADRNKVISQYLEQSLEDESGQDNDGTRLALYFKRKGSDITSYYDILADPALLKVAQTALGIPATTSSAPLESQIRAFQAKFDVKNFADPKKLDTFVRRFTAVWDAEQTDPTKTSGALAILTNGASSSNG